MVDVMHFVELFMHGEGYKPGDYAVDTRVIVRDQMVAYFGQQETGIVNSSSPYNPAQAGGSGGPSA